MKATAANRANHYRQMRYLRLGIVMLPKVPVKAKSRKKRIRNHIMRLRSTRRIKGPAI